MSPYTHTDTHSHTQTLSLSLSSALRFHELGRLGHLLLSLSTQEVLEGQISQLNIREVLKEKSGKDFSCKLEGETVCVLFKRIKCRRIRKQKC